MSRLALITILVISMTLSTPQAQSSDGGAETITNLQFYFHDIPSGKNPTAVQIIKPQAASASVTNSFFGAAVMVDDPLTETADASSKLLGRAQGMYTFSSQNESAIIMSMSFAFTDGPYKGSSLSVMGKNMILNPTRELPVLGGTGLFRMSRGYALLRTITFDTTTGDAVVFYNVTVHAPASNANEQVLSASGARRGGAASGASNSSSSSSPMMMMSGRWWMLGAVIAAAALV